MIVVTTNDLPGHRIEAVLGEVMGLTVRSANLGANFTAGFRAMGGGEIPEYTDLVYQSRQQVMARMVEEARRRGANAILAMRFDNGSIGQSFSEVCAYGTAAVVRPIPAGEPGANEQSAHLARTGGVAGAPV
ncbi:YbjQ family protein, partial [Actinotalea subterranea]|uniref:YbjQ family protein n=1 Tax=Actinotalea subterranea TaxID=2607497 RepID=UPI0011ED8A04